jgi:hypothetical protein
MHRMTSYLPGLRQTSFTAAGCADDIRTAFSAMEGGQLR